jgi:hypothetical protein
MLGVAKLLAVGHGPDRWCSQRPPSARGLSRPRRDPGASESRRRDATHGVRTRRESARVREADPLDGTGLRRRVEVLLDVTVAEMT